MRLGVVGSSYVNAEAKQQLPVSRSCEQSMPQFIPVSLEPGEKQLARKAALAFGRRFPNGVGIKCSVIKPADNPYIIPMSSIYHPYIRNIHKYLLK